MDDDHERPDEDRYIRGGGGRKQLDPNASSFFVTLDKMRESIRSLLKGRFAHWATRQPDANVQRIGGFLWSVVAGLLFVKTDIVLLGKTDCWRPTEHLKVSFSPSLPLSCLQRKPNIPTPISSPHSSLSSSSSC